MTTTQEATAEMQALVADPDFFAPSLYPDRRRQRAARVVAATLELPTLVDALVSLGRCPRSSGLPAIGSYYCECPACVPCYWAICDHSEEDADCSC